MPRFAGVAGRSSAGASCSVSDPFLTPIYIHPQRARTSIYNLAFFFLAGAASACDTLIAQSYGARDFEATEYWTRMGFLVMTLLSIPAFVLFMFGEFFVRNVFRQDEQLSRMAGRYTQLLAPGLWFMCMFIVMQKSMQARNILMPSVWIMLVRTTYNGVRLNRPTMFE